MKKYLKIFSLKILDWDIFQAILGKFRGNSDWDWGEFRPKTGPKNTDMLCLNRFDHSIL